MSSIRERQKDPYRALCKELINLTLRDMRHDMNSKAAEWLLGERENPRLRRSTVLDVLGYPRPDREAVNKIDRQRVDAVYAEDLVGDWLSAREIREEIGCSAGTVRAWWHRGEVEGRKAVGTQTMQIMIRDDERLRDRIEKYQNSRYGNA